MQHGQRREGFVAQARHRPVARIEVGLLPRRGGHRIVIEVVLPNGGAQVAVGLRSTVRLNPLVLIRRNTLLG